MTVPGRIVLTHFQMVDVSLERLRDGANRFVRQLVLLITGCVCLQAARGVEWEPGNGFRSARLSISSQEKLLFTSLEPALTGIWFTNLLSEERSLTNQIYLNGSGIAAGDVDGDGQCDLYFCSLDGPNRLFRNLGDWKFADITESSGVACADHASTAAVLADVDGDGDLDL